MCVVNFSYIYLLLKFLIIYTYAYISPFPSDPITQFSCLENLPLLSVSYTFLPEFTYLQIPLLFFPMVATVYRWLCISLWAFLTLLLASHRNWPPFPKILLNNPRHVSSLTLPSFSLRPLSQCSQVQCCFVPSRYCWRNTQVNQYI